MIVFLNFDEWISDLRRIFRREREKESLGKFSLIETVLCYFLLSVDRPLFPFWKGYVNEGSKHDVKLFCFVLFPFVQSQKPWIRSHT